MAYSWKFMRLNVDLPIAASYVHPNRYASHCNNPQCLYPAKQTILWVHPLKSAICCIIEHFYKSLVIITITHHLFDSNRGYASQGLQLNLSTLVREKIVGRIGMPTALFARVRVPMLGTVIQATASGTDAVVAT